MNSTKIPKSVYCGEYRHSSSDGPSIPCDKCDLLFTSKVHMTRHVKSVHDKIRDNLCKICHKGFTRQDYLTVHLEIHSPNRIKFECDTCKKKLNTRDGIMGHVKICPPENKEYFSTYSCEQCEGKFHSHRLLKRHLEIHERGWRSYTCNICNKRYNYQSLYKAHMRNVHLRSNNGKKSVK